LIGKNLEIKSKIHKKVLWIGDLKFNFAEGSFRVQKGAKRTPNRGRSGERGRFQSGFNNI
jgi:hypothetical protein